MPADRYRDRSQSPAQSQHHARELAPPGFFDQFLINSAPGQNRAERFARLCFPDYPNVPGDDDEVPTDSPLMTLLRENLPSMRAACRSQRREKGRGRREDRSGSDHHSTGSKGSHSDGTLSSNDARNPIVDLLRIHPRAWFILCLRKCSHARSVSTPWSSR